jgi:hypothetical protein
MSAKRIRRRRKFQTYCCSKCKQQGVKLWRDAYGFADTTKLVCAACLGITDVDDYGRALGGWCGEKTNQLGQSLLPAIVVQPFAETQTFWGYTSAPDEAWKAWYELPTYKRPTCASSTTATTTG